VISPGGIGFDINCGMRLITTNLTLEDVQPHLKENRRSPFQRVPAGVGTHGFQNYRITNRDLVEQGARWCVERVSGLAGRLELTEGNGFITGGRRIEDSERAVERGYNQVATLGSGNHYLECRSRARGRGADKELAKKFGVTIRTRSW